MVAIVSSFTVENFSFVCYNHEVLVGEVTITLLQKEGREAEGASVKL